MMYYYAVKFFSKKHNRIETFFVAREDKITSLDAIKREYKNIIDFSILNKDTFENLTKKVR